MKNVMLKGDPKGLKSEVIATELGHLWAHMLQRGVLETHRSIGFCSIGDEEGNNMMAANLALFLGSRGKRVGLIEASLRMPVMADLFDVTPAPGLADLLSDAAGLRDVLRSRVATGVDVIPAGTSSDPFWNFTSGQFKDLQRALLTERDLVLVDVPALTRAPEAALVIRSLDAVVLIVEANKHKKDVVRRNVAYLRSLGTPFLGAMLSNIVYDLPRIVDRLL